MPGWLYILAIIICIIIMIEICSSAGFPMAFGNLNKNISCTIYYSQWPRASIVISLLSHIDSTKPSTKGSIGPIISTDNINKEATHTWICFCLRVHYEFHTLRSKVFVLIALRLIPNETN